MRATILGVSIVEATVGCPADMTINTLRGREMIDLWFESREEALWWWHRLGGILDKVGGEYKLTCEG